VGLTLAFVLVSCGTNGKEPEIVTDLAAVMMETPNGYRLLEASARSFDLETYTAEMSEAPEADRQVLSAAGFDKGRVQIWTPVVGGRGIAVYVFQLGSADGAAAVLDRFVTDARVLKKAVPLAVEEIDGARGSSYPNAASGGAAQVHTVMFTRSSRLYAIVAGYDVLDADPSSVLEFAHRQATVAR